MSVCIDFADGKGGRLEGDQVATNTGWLEFGKWVDSLPTEERYRHIICLWEYGYEYAVKKLGRQLERAIAETKAPKNVGSVAEGIVHLIKQHPKSGGIFVDNDS